MKMFIYIFKSLAFLALQMETTEKKIAQPKLPKTKNELTKICNEPGIYFISFPLHLFWKCPQFLFLKGLNFKFEIFEMKKGVDIVNIVLNYHVPNLLYFCSTQH